MHLIGSEVCLVPPETSVKARQVPCSHHHTACLVSHTCHSTTSSFYICPSQHTEAEGPSGLLSPCLPGGWGGRPTGVRVGPFACRVRLKSADVYGTQSFLEAPCTVSLWGLRPPETSEARTSILFQVVAHLSPHRS